MKFCNYEKLDGEGTRAGVLHEGLVYPLSSIPAGVRGADAARLSGPIDPASLPRLAEITFRLHSGDPRTAYRADRALDPAGLRFLPPVLPAASFRDFYAFEAHVKTARGRRGLEMIPEWYDMPVFYFSNHTSMLGHGDTLSFPAGGQWLDYELEVAAVIGRPGRDIPAGEAEQYIAGYTILNDWSLRDCQRDEMKVGLGPAKGKDFATGIGPLLVTPDELEPFRSGKGFDRVMTARVNGREYSRGNWKDIHYSFGEMIERASRNVDLFPGDVIGSGTVGTGCILELGPDTVDGWLKPGDVVELEIDGFGTLANSITARPAEEN
jgi:2-keto-4-pentenoate hydratase/2-oxohepta-3-ene-1,7-dioic acid hydratase in catechol pathway